TVYRIALEVNALQSVTERARCIEQLCGFRIFGRSGWIQRFFGTRSIWTEVTHEIRHKNRNVGFRYLCSLRYHRLNFFLPTFCIQGPAGIRIQTMALGAALQDNLSRRPIGQFDLSRYFALSMD